MKSFKVVKRDGREEPFIREKLVTSLVKAGAEIGVAREIAREIEERLREKRTVTTRELREMALEELGKRNPEARENWLVYDRAVKKRR